MSEVSYIQKASLSPPNTLNFTSSFSGELQIMQMKSFLTVAASVAPGAWTRMWWNPRASITQM